MSARAKAELVLAGERLAGPARAARTAGKAAEEGTWLTHVCGRCGKKGGGYLRHYEVMTTCCGEFVWALQPKRSGPLKLFPHPGFAQRPAEPEEDDGRTPAD
jgi:hypothetical protein